MSNNSIFELAQLLTGALDENFNIKNQSAVIKVVSCLEAFNITHDSYREVQNTRLIKDLQALRQNKANDQLLAKRIKNLLRKWKERLATAVAVNNNSSHPNSPQNFSQVSSDATIFMTQHSQSPPNSLPSSQHALQKQIIVNGPTTFANVIPKGIVVASSVTSPSLPPQRKQSHLNTNHNSHNHKNGGFELSSSSMPGSTGNLLGKRKFEGLCNDIDENSNHSRKKMMKKSAAAAVVGPISSPQIPPSIVMNNPKIVPVLQPQQQQQMKQPTPPFNLQQQQPVINSFHEEAPKKRGRRKGSKGIDSTLNGSAIPDFQAEIQQKIALSAGKRNKTTFELQKMLSESHQQQNASISTMPSLANEDTIDNRVPFMPSTVTENEKRAPMSHKQIKTEIKVEDKNELKVPATASSQLDSITSRSLTTEEEIKRLEALLPPINYKAAAQDIFGDYVTLDSDGNIVECTCTFREVITYADELEKEQVNGGGLQDKIEENGDNFKINSKFSVGSEEEEEEDDDDDETDDFCAVEDIIEKSPTPPPMKSAVKSIFDPEYDANENLIEEMVRSRKLIRDAPKVIEVKIEKDNVKSTRMESMMNNFEPDNVMLPSERIPIINYECDEDPMCPARAHFRRNSVTKHDVDRLHNSYVPGVNGDFNGILDPKPKHDYSKDSENIDYKKHQLWKRVVPRYNFLTLDDVPKKFDSFTHHSIPPFPTDEDDDVNVEVKKEEGTINGNNLTSFDDLKNSHGEYRDLEFREWYQPMNVRSYKDEILTILPYVVID